MTDFESLPIERVAVHVQGPKCDQNCGVLHVRHLTQAPATEVGSGDNVYIGPIEHISSQCRKDGCDCWCEGCERHKWRASQDTKPEGRSLERTIKERDALAATVERLREALWHQMIRNHDCNPRGCSSCEDADRLTRATEVVDN